MDPFGGSDMDMVAEGNGNVEYQNGNDFAASFADDTFAPPAPQETDPFGTAPPAAPAAPVEEDFFGEPAASAPPPMAPPAEEDAEEDAEEEDDDDLFTAAPEFASVDPPVTEDAFAPPAPPAPPVDNNAISCVPSLPIFLSSLACCQMPRLKT
eukprot:6305628-Pyramimonas_sp.AAC.1